MSYQVEVYKCDHWQHATPDVTGVKKLYGYTIYTARFSRVIALEAAKDLHSITRLPTRVRDENDISPIWSSNFSPSIESLTIPEYQREDTTMTPDLNKPLTIDRDVLIAKLQENLDAEVAKRVAAEAEQAAVRQEALDAIAAFTPDELYNIFRDYYSTEATTLKFDKEHKSYVTHATEPTRLENDLEKFVRVLTMASDKTVEITPNESIYKLL